MRFLIALFSTVWIATAAAGEPSIRVQAGDWGGASTRDIEAVLRSVAHAVLRDFSRHADVRVVVAPDAAGPRVLAAKSASGEHQVLLSVRDARWDQFAYQFAHELCHITSNYDERPVMDARAHQWFEESVCEAVSIITLQRLAVQWQQSPPHEGWQAYAPAFSEYAERLMASPHRRLPESFALWYRDHAAQMAGDPYLREKNERVASALVQLFAADGLQAVGYLNVHAIDARTFDEYLDAWLDCCPPPHRALVQRVIELFRT